MTALHLQIVARRSEIWQHFGRCLKVEFPVRCTLCSDERTQYANHFHVLKPQRCSAASCCEEILLAMHAFWNVIQDIAALASLAEAYLSVIFSNRARASSSFRVTLCVELSSVTASKRCWQPAMLEETSYFYIASNRLLSLSGDGMTLNCNYLLLRVLCA